MCRHHWLIGIPNGKESQGVCMICGEIKYFRNGIDLPDYTNRLNLKSNRKGQSKLNHIDIIVQPNYHGGRSVY